MIEKIFKNYFYYKHKKSYLFILFLNVVIMLLLLALNSFTNRFVTHNKHITYQIVNIKYLVTESHLWMEEYLSGDYEEYSKIDHYLNKSISELDVLLRGGKIKGLAYNPKYNDEKLLAYLLKIEKQLNEIQDQKRLRIKKTIHKMEDNYDHQFKLLKDTFHDTEEYIDYRFGKMFSYYTTIKYVIYTSLILLFIFGLYLVVKLNDEIKTKDLLSHIDGLTNIQNRKAYKKSISKLLYMFKKEKVPFTVIMFDIDNFKQINDRYGHREGDKVLVDLTQLVKSHIRSDYDAVYRVGGEEFVILCANSTLSDSIKIAEKIRKLVQIALSSIEGKTITISIGVSEVLDGDTEDSIYKRVDENLYASKNNGKNMVTSDNN